MARRTGPEGSLPERSPRAFRARVEGRVQGVGFRYSAMREARGLGLRGWVRNEDDGSVSLHAEGDPAALDSLAAWLEKGPPGAFVTALKLQPTAPTGSFRDFGVDF